MKRPLILIILLLTVVVAAQGQGRGRPWKRGPLRVEDFGIVAAQGRDNSHLEYAINILPGGLTEGLHTYQFCRTSAVMFPTASWMAEGHVDDAELTYNQMLFDLVEVHRRQMQREAMLLTKRAQYERLLEISKTNLDREIEAVKAATQGGRDSLAVERIRVKNLEWLNANVFDRPEFVQRPFWWYVSIDFGMLLTAGSLARHYSPFVSTQGYTFGYGYKRHGLYLQAFSGTAYSLDTLPADWYYESGSRFDLNIGYGFTLLDGPSFSLTPYLAYGLTEYSFWSGESYTLGVIGRYHFHHWHRLTNAVKGKARCYTVSAAGKLYLSYADLGDDYKGVTFGVQVGLSLLTRKERVEW